MWFSLLMAITGFMFMRHPKVQGYTIDLPEEIKASTGNDLETFKRGDTIFIQFKNATNGNN